MQKLPQILLCILITLLVFGCTETNSPSIEQEKCFPGGKTYGLETYAGDGNYPLAIGNTYDENWFKIKLIDVGTDFARVSNTSVATLRIRASFELDVNGEKSEFTWFERHEMQGEHSPYITGAPEGPLTEKLSKLDIIVSENDCKLTQCVLGVEGDTNCYKPTRFRLIIK
jgi:hypothetical protein